MSLQAVFRSGLGKDVRRYIAYKQTLEASRVGVGAADPDV